MNLYLRELAARTWRKCWDDEVFGESARLAFYLFFAMFPVLLLLLIFLGKSVAAGSEWRNALLDSFNQALPADASSLLAETIRQLSTRSDLGLGAVLAGVGAVWGALNGTWAIIAGLNRAFGVKEDRPWWRVLALAAELTLYLFVLGLIALAGILYGNRAAPAELVLLRRFMQWAFCAVLLLLSFAVLYRFGPNLKGRCWNWSIPGAVVGVTLWSIAGVLLRIYEDHLSSSARIYGGLNSVITLLLWLYLTAASLFIGGEVNYQVEKADASGNRLVFFRNGRRRSTGRIGKTESGKRSAQAEAKLVGFHEGK